MDQASYPGIWVSYEDTEELTIAGIAHEEFAEGDDGQQHRVTRWKFGGVITLTLVALSSLERDRFYDELVRTFAFAREESTVSAFRDLVEQNDLVAMNINFDNLRPGGDSAAPGTPWGTDDIIYEKSLTMDVIGEFISDPNTGALLYLSKIITLGYGQGTPEPPFPDDPPGVPLDPGRPGEGDSHFRVDTWH